MKIEHPKEKGAPIFQAFDVTPQAEAEDDYIYPAAEPGPNRIPEVYKSAPLPELMESEVEAETTAENETVPNSLPKVSEELDLDKGRLNIIKTLAAMLLQMKQRQPRPSVCMTKPGKRRCEVQMPGLQKAV